MIRRAGLQSVQPLNHPTTDHGPLYACIAAAVGDSGLVIWGAGLCVCAQHETCVWGTVSGYAMQVAGDVKPVWKV